MTCGALGHPGGSFSEAEFLAVLFNYVLRFDARSPDWPMRDVFYLSKCHAAARRSTRSWRSSVISPIAAAEVLRRVGLAAWSRIPTAW